MKYLNLPPSELDSIIETVIVDAKSIVSDYNNQIKYTSTEIEQTLMEHSEPITNIENDPNPLSPEDMLEQDRYREYLEFEECVTRLKKNYQNVLFEQRNDNNVEAYMLECRNEVNTKLKKNKTVELVAENKFYKHLLEKLTDEIVLENEGDLAVWNLQCAILNKNEIKKFNEDYEKVKDEPITFEVAKENLFIKNNTDIKKPSAKVAMQFLNELENENLFRFEPVGTIYKSNTEKWAKRAEKINDKFGWNFSGGTLENKAKGCDGYEPKVYELLNYYDLNEIATKYKLMNNSTI
jgi:hypothetical protein